VNGFSILTMSGTPKHLCFKWLASKVSEWVSEWATNCLLWLSQTEMLYCTTLVGLPFLLPPMFLTNEIFKAWSDCYQVHITSHKLSFAIHFLLRIVCLFVCLFTHLLPFGIQRLIGTFFPPSKMLGRSLSTIWIWYHTIWNWLRACFWHWMINVIYLPLLYHFMSL
jgi:hypothetical protein